MVSLYARLNSHYEAWNYKKKKKERMKSIEKAQRKKDVYYLKT